MWSSIQLADILTKPLEASIFESLKAGLRVFKLMAYQLLGVGLSKLNMWAYLALVNTLCKLKSNS